MSFLGQGLGKRQDHEASAAARQRMRVGVGARDAARDDDPAPLGECQSVILW